MSSHTHRYDGLWAITCYFNPLGWRRKRGNYRIFRQHLKVPLLAVELGYGTGFELDGSDAEILIQTRGGDILWQKERLLNVALRALPNDCDKVAWIDCDVLFGREDWPEQVSDLLDRFALLQPFSRVHHLPRDWSPGDLRPAAAELTRTSAACAIAAGVPARTVLCDNVGPGGHTTYAKGLSWAARRAWLELHGFYDTCIVGGGDMAIACAAHGCIDEVMALQHMSGRQRERFFAWAGSFHRTFAGATGYLEGSVFHLWHGELRHRRYRNRFAELAPFGFDPFEDVIMDDGGCWRWSSDKPTMHDHVRAYFAARREDG